jgi:hypothetical protein
MLAALLAGLLHSLGPPEGPEPPLEVEETGDYVIVEAAPASAFESPAPRPIEFRSGALIMVRGGVTRSRTVADDGDSSFELPTRLRAQLEARTQSFRMLAQVQDARTLADPLGSPRTGVHQLLGEYRTSLPRGDLRLRVGRQEYVLGDRHLFAQAPWTPGARSWDGVFLDFASARGGVEVFAGSIARPFLSAKEPLVDHWKSEVSLDAVMVGHYLIHSALRIEGLVWSSNRRDLDDTRKLVTTGLRLSGELTPGLTYDADGQLQLGVIERLDVRQRHVAGHAFATLDYFSPRGFGQREQTQPGAFVRFDFASGTRCTTTEYSGLAPCTDGTSHDFDSIWMDQHRWFGLADRFRAQNILDAAVGARVLTKPSNELELELGVTNHVFAFAQPGGRWHAADGQRIGVVLDNRDPWAAEEVDVVAELRYRWLRFDVGWSLVANLSGGRAVSGEALRQFMYIQLIIDLWSPWR